MAGLAANEFEAIRDGQGKVIGFKIKKAQMKVHNFFSNCSQATFIPMPLQEAFSKTVSINVDWKEEEILKKGF